MTTSEIATYSDLGNGKPSEHVSPPYRGMVALDLSDDWRKNAADCLKLSQEAHTLESRHYWLSMAAFWFRLAQHAEDREAIESADP
jgi:hypothetical protein